MQRIKTERKREERHKAIYTGSFHKSEVVLSPLHFQREFTKFITNAQAQLQETSNAQEHNQETSNAQAQLQESSIKQSYKENV